MSAMIAEPIRAMPNPAETWAIYRAQSLLTSGGKVGPILTPGCAQQVIDGITAYFEALTEHPAALPGESLPASP
jgi:hypothetical protein